MPGAPSPRRWPSKTSPDIAAYPQLSTKERRMWQMLLPEQPLVCRRSHEGRGFSSAGMLWTSLASLPSSPTTLFSLHCLLLQPHGAPWHFPNTPVTSLRVVNIPRRSLCLELSPQDGLSGNFLLFKIFAHWPSQWGPPRPSYLKLQASHLYPTLPWSTYFSR